MKRPIILKYETIGNSAIIDNRLFERFLKKLKKFGIEAEIIKAKKNKK